jgi:hypothetical protein
MTASTLDNLGPWVPVCEAVRSEATRDACQVSQVPPYANMEASTVGSVLWLGATAPGTRNIFITSLLTNIALKKSILN